MPDANNKHVVIQPKSIKVNLTPYALGQFARDLETAIDSIDTSERFSAAKFFLVCLSIEISLKSCLRAAGLSKKEAFGHDLVNLAEHFKEKIDSKLLSVDDVNSLKQATPFYDKDGDIAKGAVYFETNMKSQALKGYKDLPVDELMQINNKLHKLLEGNDYYIKLG